MSTKSILVSLGKLVLCVAVYVIGLGLGGMLVTSHKLQQPPMLASLTWISNSLNNQIEASYFGNMASGFLFTIITFLIPSVLVAANVAEVIHVIKDCGDRCKGIALITE